MPELPGDTWRAAGSITATEPALGVDERDNASVMAFLATKTVIYRRRGDKVWAEVRFRMDGNNDQTAILHMYAASGDDHFNYMGQLTITQGLHDSTSEHFAQTILPASENTFFEAVEWDAADEIARYAWKMKGYDRFLFIASTLNVTTVFVDVREYNAS